MYKDQSCMVQGSIAAIRRNCCTEKTPAIQSRITGDILPTADNGTDSVPSALDLEAQRTCNYGRLVPSLRIVGGSAARAGEFPWITMLVRDGKNICSGVIVDAKHVITAGHCLEYNPAGTVFEVLAGKHKTSILIQEANEQRVNVTSFVIHEEYDPNEKKNDIALMELATPLRWTDYVMPACLPDPDDVMPDSCVVAGWGNTQAAPATTLRKVHLQAYTTEECESTFNQTTVSNLEKYLHPGVICAANALEGGKDACSGDSGGPLMCTLSTNTSAANFVFGLVSNGNNCALPGEPGLYVSVPYFLSWINATTASMS